MPEGGGAPSQDPRLTHNDPFANDRGVSLLLNVIAAIMERYGHAEFESDLHTLDMIRKETVAAFQEHSDGKIYVRLQPRPGSIKSPFEMGLVRPQLVVRRANGTVRRG